ncbi:rod shape-determining protein MreC [Thiohalospira halophila DSM 15071]|uniref:Cell shape-determining protein MreC n=2 Tax=Thiohalospira halophila TaxID=381300 RepID=A0A1I1TMN0_9GAMM|nr:rod shape-determining protein MreC [Thiohalospira halophila DSM 15071]
MAVDHRQNHLETIRGMVSTVIYPLQLAADAPASLAGMLSSAMTSQRDLRRELAELKRERLFLEAELQRMAALEAENERLRRLFESSRALDERLEIAEILSVDLDPFSRQVALNKGSQQDLYRGQPVLDRDGVMGQLTHVGPLSSTAMLLTDPAHAIPVQINRTGRRAIAVGTGSAERLDIPYIPNNADIRNGDLLVTSGLGGRFPSGYPVARITNIEPRPGESYARVDAEPLARIHRVREVLLVWSDQGDNPAGEPSVPAETAPAGAADEEAP